MITLRNLTLRRGTKIVLDDATVTLQPGERIGLVGANGAGKSSLFALLAGRLQADRGDAEMPPTWRLSEVAQHLPETEQGATDFVLDGDLTLLKAREQLAAAEAAHDGLKMAEAHAALQDAGSFDARPRAQSLLLGLGFKVDQLDAPVNSFSGGWRMRLQLARTLINPAELMLLDEPTNHLDLDALVWLEGWLSRYPGTLLVISHDREFLDAITRVTLHLEHAKLTRWGGNYTTFETLRAQAQVLQQASFEKQQDRIKHLQHFIDRFKAKASKAKQAQSRVKALERMEKLAPVLAAADFAFEFREPANLPNPMLALSDLACGYGDTAIVRKIDRTVLAGQRIGILGANGQGKSTVVKTIARTMPPLSGSITEGKGLTIGYFAQQELDVLRPEEGPLAHMVRLAKEVSPQAREQELRDFLGQFRFTGDMVSQEVGSLSGGEKARLVLAMLVWQRPNLLLLDEPTNHLDLQTREALSIALNEFEGTVMLVSHDRALLREVCDEFWLVADGALKPFDGDLDDYQRWLNERAREEAKALRAAAAPAPSADDAPAASQREDRKAAAQARAKLADQTRPLRKEIEAIDKKLVQLGQEREGLEAELATGALDPGAIANCGRRLKVIADETDALELRWLELSEQIEAATAAAGL
ncbi:ABC-F family ATP-binding cassette domain-containing protein [Inhella proteolytica]|uniref:Probable ATP-binding protein YheS n=1 Tax=Inhella proteolytica TaxID=2795029 RepID=A0A931IXJ2_9BURK|nr:ATP-binding cassette domain-containing protein [Inhella proteolytica]MBH9575541.1 ATP-binding cassette domain-containing protein [Inhella proteolytica]